MTAGGAWLTRDRGVWGLAGLVFVLAFVAFPLRTEWLNAGRDGIVVTPDGLTPPYGGRELCDALWAATPEGRALYAWSEVTLDVVFPVAYVALLVLLLRGVWVLPPRWARPGRTLLLLVPLVAGGADLVENVALFQAARHPAWRLADPDAVAVALDPLAALASRAASVKWVATGLVLLLLVSGLVRAGRLGRIASLLWLARAPVFGLTTLLALASLGSGARPSPTIPNMLVLDTFGGLTAVAFIAAYSAALAGFSLALVWDLAPMRSGATLPRRPAFLGAPAQASARLGRLFLVFALPLVFLCAVRSALGSAPRLALWQVVVAALLGVALCWLALDLVEWLRLRLMRLALRLPTRPLTWLARVSGAGYYDEQTHNVLPGHGLALAGAITGLVVYFLGQWLLAPERSFPDSRAVPTLAYVLTMLAILVSLLGGATFFFDRWRVPLTGVVLGLLVLRGGTSGHLFDARWQLPAQRQALCSVSAAAGARLGDAPPFAIVVTASGGGIQAAAWTARVLTGLQQFHEDLIRRVALISSTSGGSVGVWFFLSAFDQRGVVAPDRLTDVVQAAGSSALEATAWGLTYPDLQRALGFGGRSLHDRGWAMERGWLAARREHHLGDPRGEDWSAWAAKTGVGQLPAVVFNSIRIDDGLPLRFATVDSERYRPFAYGGTQGGGLDLETVTAARLSATFPYLSPLARPAACAGSGSRDCWAAADGGYLDNDGTLAALAWLSDFKNRRSAPLPRVLWIQIDGFPETARPAQPESGWTLSLLGPPQGLLRVRTAGQQHRRDVEVELMQMAYRADAAELEVVRLRPPLQTEPRPREAPLSWQLGRRDLERIESDWQAVLAGSEFARLREFVWSAKREAVAPR